MSSDAAGPSSSSLHNDQPDIPRASSVPLNPSGFNVGYVYSTEMMSHFCPTGHPETPQRISYIYNALTLRRHTHKMKLIPIRIVKRDEALLVHSEDHWDKVQAIKEMSDQEMANSADYYEQLSLYVMRGTTRAALLSCGGVIEASLAVARGELQKSFAIVRPPGHHAEPDEHMGFCFFNNVAVAARVVQQLTPIKKILILDCSVNIPWPERGMTDADYLHAFQKIVMPIALEFVPELVIISAGFDAAQGDDLGECHVSPAGYAHMTHMLSGLAGGRLVVALEGGYNLDSISRSALAVTGILLGEAPEQLPPMTASESGTETVFLVAREQSKYWKSVDPKACEPREGLEDISFSIPEILKSHRQHYLYTQHDMMQIPLITAELERRFSTQIMCTSDIFENTTMVVFLHEFGNLRIELQSSTTLNVEMERSYLLDFSKELVSWVKNKKYSLLDANLFPKPVPITTRMKASDDFGKDILTYLWDNYVQLSSARDVILIGHGPGSRPIMDLLERRTASVMKSVKAVVQIVGHSTLPATPKYMDDLTEWYRKNSFVVLPSTHSALTPTLKPKDLRRHGELVPIDESQVVRLIHRALPGIAEFVAQQLGKPEVPTE
ncbi:hypothetical protein H0H92_014462 [Tricholoma furcatifolium]|nr:hypothetical protein H0H92_014462 [Tricholoma furcatifolium]